MLTMFRNLFLLERVYIVRAPFVKRIRDPVWITGAIITFAGYFGVMGYQYINPKSRLSREDGVCRIGIQSEAASAFMVLDLMTTVVLTVIFVWHLRRTSTSLQLAHASRQGKRMSSVRQFISHGKKDVERNYYTSGSRRNVRHMLIRNVIGSVLLLVSTIVNKTIFLTWDFAKMGHTCLLMCLSDGMFTCRITAQSADTSSRIRYAYHPMAHHETGGRRLRFKSAFLLS